MLPTKSYFFFGSKIALLGGTAGDLSSLLFPILNTLWLWGQFGDFVELKAWVWPLWERGWCRGPRAGPTDRWQRRRKAVTKLWPKANLSSPLSVYTIAMFTNCQWYTRGTAGAPPRPVICKLYCSLLKPLFNTVHRRGLDQNALHVVLIFIQLGIGHLGKLRPKSARDQHRAPNELRPHTFDTQVVSLMPPSIGQTNMFCLSI